MAGYAWMIFILLPLFITAQEFLPPVFYDWKHVCINSPEEITCPRGYRREVVHVYSAYREGGCTDNLTGAVHELTDCYSRANSESSRIADIQRECYSDILTKPCPLSSPALGVRVNYTCSTSPSPFQNMESYYYKCTQVPVFYDWKHVCINSPEEITCPRGYLREVVHVYSAYREGGCTDNLTGAVHELTDCYSRARSESRRIFDIRRECYSDILTKPCPLSSPALGVRVNYQCSTSPSPLQNMESYYYKCTQVPVYYDWKHVCVNTTGELSCPPGFYTEVVHIYSAYREEGCTGNLTDAAVHDLTGCYSQPATEYDRIDAIKRRCNRTNVCTLEHISPGARVRYMCSTTPSFPLRNMESYYYTCRRG